MKFRNEISLNKFFSISLSHYYILEISSSIWLLAFSIYPKFQLVKLPYYLIFVLSALFTTVWIR